MYRKRLHILALMALVVLLLAAPMAKAQDAGPTSLLPPPAAEAAPSAAQAPDPSKEAEPAVEKTAESAPVVHPAPAAAIPNTPKFTSAKVVVRVGQHEEFDRIVFDWPRQVSYKVTRDGAHAAIHFAASGEIELAPAAKLTRGRHFTASHDADGNLAVSFDINPKSTLKDFFSGASIAVDITGAAVAEGATPPPTESKIAPKVVAAAAPAPKAAPTPAPVATSSPAAPPAVITPPLATPIKPADVMAVGTSAITITQTPGVPAVDIATPAKSAPASLTTLSTASPASATSPTSKNGMKTLIVGTEPLLVASLDPHTPLRAAVWARGGKGYIVFDKKLTLTVDALSAGLPAPAVTLASLDIAKASGYSFPIPDNVDVHATREGTIWKIFLTKQQPEVPVTASLVAQPDFALGARYLLPLPDAPDPLHFTDPVVGDELVIIPLNETQAFSVFRRMADFQIWPAAQGLVIKPLSEKVIVRPVSDGIEITSEAGLHLSPATDTGGIQQSPQKARSAAAGKSLFDFAGWRGKPKETFTQARQRLQQTVVDVPERERDRARLELARFYFARGYGAEALALLGYLAQDVPDLTRHSDFLALTGAAKIMGNRPDEGLKDLEDASLPDQPELKLWQAVGNAELRNWVEAEDQFVSSQTLLQGYPEPFFSRFYVLAVEAALAVGNNREAAEWLDQLQSAPHSDEVEPAIGYLHGVLHAKAGRAQSAATAWKVVAASNDRLYKVRAEMALIDLGVANKSLTAAQAADRLDALRFAWRGDDLEVDILHRLGLFDIKAHNVKTGLGVLASALRLYPHSPFAPKIQSEMSETFRDVFLGELGKNLSPLEALTLYQEYRATLIPTGDDGIAVTRNLAERLTAIDLMEQAGDLLEDLVKNKLKGDEKAHVAVRLAAIRMLDHKPQQALDALDISNGETLPVPLQHERTLLRAKALSELHHEDDALAVLKDENQVPAKILRADINMRAQHWEEAAKNLLDLVGPPPRAGETLRDEQADWLVRAALAMANTGDQVGLDRLAIDYGAAMAGTSKNDTFRVLVQPEKIGQLRDITAAQSKISEVDMFQGFLDSYRKPQDSSSSPDAKKP